MGGAGWAAPGSVLGGMCWGKGSGDCNEGEVGGRGGAGGCHHGSGGGLFSILWGAGKGWREGQGLRVQGKGEGSPFFQPFPGRADQVSPRGAREPLLSPTSGNFGHPGDKVGCSHLCETAWGNRVSSPLGATIPHGVMGHPLLLAGLEEGYWSLAWPPAWAPHPWRQAWRLGLQPPLCPSE